MIAPTGWDLRGKTALVTGGTRGIGAAIVEEFLRLGAAVSVVARGKDGLDRIVRSWRDAGYTVDGVPADVSTSEGISTIVDHVGTTPLDILVNNAGTNIRKPTGEYSEEELDLLFRTNMFPPLELSRKLRAALAKGGHASVVNVVSVAGLTSLGTGAPYAMAKAALIQLTRYLAVEWSKDGIRVNAVAPWYIRTPLVAPLLSDDATMRRILERTPLKRIGEPNEVAAAVAFLVMPAASYITGQCLAVDGGFMAYGYSRE